MAHHHSAPNHPHDEGKELGDFKVHSTVTGTPNLNHSSREVEKEKQGVPPQEKRMSVFDYRIAGFPWPFVAIISLIAIAVLGMILRVMGVF